ncbi:MAG: META domain-containing protein [Ardenticatenaceae bacterium]|nr:META domain-containing protein [Ardenticatenaceae bacterium]
MDHGHDNDGLIFSAACTAGAGSEPAIDSEDESVTISGQVWQWQALEDAADGDESSNITVDDPANYTLELLADGTYTIQADCNSGSGQYTLDDSSLTLEPYPITLAECAISSRFLIPILPIWATSLPLC